MNKRDAKKVLKIMKTGYGDFVCSRIPITELAEDIFKEEFGED